MADMLGFLDGGGEASRLIRERDWTGHPLGCPDRWPEALKTALSLVLNSPESMILAWGEQLSFFFNETYFPLLGPRLSWAMGEPFERVWADGWEQAKPIIDDALAGQSKRFEDLPWKLGTDRGAEDTWWTFSYSRVLGADGAVAGLFIFTNETTGRVLADRKLAGETERQRLSLQQMPGFAAVVVGPDHVFDYINDAYVTISGPRAFIGNGVREVFPELANQGFYELLDQVYATGERFVARAIPVRMSGEEQDRHVDLLYQAIHDDGGGVTGIFIGGYDVTERIHAERALADANAMLEQRIAEALKARESVEEALRQSQKMEAVGQLTGGLAHDFNNLLTAVTGGLDLLEHRLAQGRYDDLDRYVGMAKTGAYRAAALTQRLLAFSRRQTLAPTPTDVDRLIAGMQEIISRSIGPAIMVSVIGSADLWPVLVDAPQLENALLNLCINARDAMPEGGGLTIETGNKLLDANAAAAQDLPEGEYVSLCVTDTGAGMTPEVIERVFDPFFTTKPIGEGTGLGLSMIYGFVRQSGGQVRVYSEIGKGTTMCLYLPRYVGDVDVVDRVSPIADDRRAGAGQTVLLVEDEASIRQLVGEVLGEAGYRVIEAATGLIGINLLQSRERIDLLITDVGLPGGLNGRQVADAGRALRPALKVLFVTGYAANAAVGAGHLDEGMEVLTKPFNLLDLARRVHNLLEA